jgi:hypothetical protein
MSRILPPLRSCQMTLSRLLTKSASFSFSRRSEAQRTAQSTLDSTFA